MDLPTLTEQTKEVTRVVVRLHTSAYKDRRGGIHLKKSLLPQRKLSTGLRDWIEEEADGMGALDMMNRVTNLDECADGLYEVVTCNESRDWESGHVDDYDFKLLPYQEKK